MKRPAFQFYPADWRNNAKLRRCSEAARGAWIDVLCLMHDSDEYGVLRWPLADIARAAGLPIKYLKELADKGVLKGSDKGCDPFIYTPRHAGRDGEPVTLISSESGPIWYCSRFVRDEHIRQKRGSGTRFDNEGNQPNRKPKMQPIPPFGDAKGDGPTSTSTNKPSLSPAPDDRLDDPGFSDYHRSDWQPDLELLAPMLARSGCAMPEAAFLANSLNRFNLNFSGRVLTTGETYSRLVRWISEDVQREKSRQTRFGGTGSQPHGFERGDAIGEQWLIQEREREAGTVSGFD